MKKILSLALALVLVLAMVSPISLAGTYEETVQAMYEEEYLAQSTYEKVVEQFGKIRPFVNIINAEKNHVKAVERLADTKGITLADKMVEVEEFVSLDDAYKAAIAIEKEDIEMLEAILKDDTLDEYTKTVYGNLLKGSKNHLEAFEKASTTPGTKTQTNNGAKGNQQGNARRQDGICVCDGAEDCPLCTGEKRLNRQNNSKMNGPKEGTGMGQGKGMGQGQGLRDGSGQGLKDGSGMGQGLRDGSGQNENCPLKTK